MELFVQPFIESSKTNNKKSLIRNKYLFSVSCVCRQETHGWQKIVLKNVPAVQAEASSVSQTPAKPTHCALLTKTETSIVDPIVSKLPWQYKIVFFFQVFVSIIFFFFFLILSPFFRFWPVHHLRRSSLQNIWWRDPPFPRPLYLCSHPGAKRWGSWSDTVWGAWEKHQTWR